MAWKSSYSPERTSTSAHIRDPSSNSTRGPGARVDYLSGARVLGFLHTDLRPWPPSDPIGGGAVPSSGQICSSPRATPARNTSRASFVSGPYVASTRSSNEILADISISSLFCVSYESFAEEISRARTRAVIVLTRAIPSFTTSFVSALRWCSGRVARRNMPSSPPPKRHPNTIKLMATALKLHLSARL